MTLMEFGIRAATAGVLILIGLLQAAKGQGFNLERKVALFSFGTAAYVLISMPEALTDFASTRPLLIILATYNSVFFWWLATSLFNDNENWAWWRLGPFAALSVLLLWRFWAPEASPQIRMGLNHAILLGLMAHAIWVARQFRQDDLIERRRRFRVIFALTVGTMGLIIATAETLLGTSPAGPVLSMLHAAGLATLTFGFSLWVLTPKPLFEPPPKAAPIPEPPPFSPADQLLLERLQRLMEDGTYRRENLTVSSLALEMDLPEHQLRRLINGTLGHRNFSAFLNTWRIDEAKRHLADPSQARRQILQIALDLGYGSIGPFNRAFKSSTGMTPTEFRKAQGGK